VGTDKNVVILEEWEDFSSDIRIPRPREVPGRSQTQYPVGYDEIGAFGGIIWTIACAGADIGVNRTCDQYIDGFRNLAERVGMPPGPPASS
jgi:hypothetical protein